MTGKLAVVLLAIGTAGVWILAGQQPVPTVFTADQAAAGREAYHSTCVNCHGDSLIPEAGAKYMKQDIPPLAGKDFMARWGTQTTSDLAIRIRTAIGGFPPKGTDAKTYLNLTAFVLQTNGARAGAQELTASTAVAVQATTAASESTTERH